MCNNTPNVHYTTKPTVLDWFTAAPDANSVLTTASWPCSLATNNTVAPLPCTHTHYECSTHVSSAPSKARLASGRTGGTPSVLFTLAPSSSAALTPPSSPSRAAVISCATEAAPRTSVQRGSIGGDRCSTIAFTNHTPSCSARSPLPCTTVISSQLQAPHQSHTCETTHQRHTNDTPATHNVSSTSPLLHSTTPRSGRKTRTSPPQRENKKAPAPWREFLFLPASASWRTRMNAPIPASAPCAAEMVSYACCTTRIHALS